MIIERPRDEEIISCSTRKVYTAVVSSPHAGEELNRAASRSAPIEIRDPSQLGSLLSSWRLTPPRRPREIHIAADDAARAHVRAWEQQLSRLHSSCGCDQGAAGLLVGGIGYLLFMLVRRGGWASPGWHDLWVACGVMLVTTSMGKLIGIVSARRRLRRLVEHIQAEWKPQRPQPRDHGPVTAPVPRLSRGCCGGGQGF
ncbi:MAG TPA: hypothetical protein VFT22_19110 [Kofleriaceae bacterium]|nr:hypothetical protein [Kofleriaceae bacterium]